MNTLHTAGGIGNFPHPSRVGEDGRGWHVTDPLLQYSSPYVGMGNRPSGMVDPNGMWTIGGWLRNLIGKIGWAKGDGKGNNNYYTAENNWTEKEGSKYVDIGSAAQGFMNILHGSSGIYQESGGSGGGGGGGGKSASESSFESVSQFSPEELCELYMPDYKLFISSMFDNLTSNNISSNPPDISSFLFEETYLNAIPGTAFSGIPAIITYIGIMELDEDGNEISTTHYSEPVFSITDRGIQEFYPYFSYSKFNGYITWEPYHIKYQNQDYKIRFQFKVAEYAWKFQKN